MQVSLALDWLHGRAKLFRGVAQTGWRSNGLGVSCIGYMARATGSQMLLAVVAGEVSLCVDGGADANIIFIGMAWLYVDEIDQAVSG